MKLGVPQGSHLGLPFLNISKKFNESQIKILLIELLSFKGIRIEITNNKSR